MLYQFTHICFNKINLYGRGVFYIIFTKLCFCNKNSCSKKLTDIQKQLQQLPEETDLHQMW